MENYAAVKERLVPACRTGGTAMVGVDDDCCAAIAERLSSAARRSARSRCGGR